MSCPGFILKFPDRLENYPTVTSSNYTHLALVVDRSGSMADIADDAQGGINTLIKEQFEEDGKLTVTLSDFDDHFSDVVRMSGKPFEYKLSPRGSTALLDAVGKEIARTGAELDALPEALRPEKVLFVVVTDGQENSSKEFSLDAVKASIKHRRDKDNWTFQFIGADENAWQGREMGMNSSTFNRSDKGQRGAYKSMNDSLKSYRKEAKPGIGFVMPEEIPDDED
jgi:hypothetical protein